LSGAQNPEGEITAQARDPGGENQEAGRNQQGEVVKLFGGKLGSYGRQSSEVVQVRFEGEKTHRADH